MNALTEDDTSDTDSEATPQGIAIIPPHNLHPLLPNYLITLPKTNGRDNDDDMFEESGDMGFSVQVQLHLQVYRKQYQRRE